MISLIAATDHNRLIGNNGELPWHLPEDLRHFRSLTLDKPVIMGRKTYESIGKPLDRRINIVLTNQRLDQVDGCRVVHSADEALRVPSDAEEIMVIGGESVFRTFRPQSDRIYLTVIHNVYKGDTYFPRLEPDEWFLSDFQDPSGDPSQEDFSYFILDRATSKPLNWRKLETSKIPDFMQRCLRDPNPSKQ